MDRHGRLSDPAAPTPGREQALDQSPKLYGLSVSDLGPGFAPRPARLEEHLGLANLREHIELLSGRFTVESELGRVTRLEAWLPLQERAG